MRGYLAYIKINLKLTLRDRLVLFFNYAFPLVFFFIFAQSFHGEQGGAINQVVTMVLIIGILGNGFFGAGIRAVQDREMNILRRFKVAPITPAPILVASIVTGWLNYMPSVVLILGLAGALYGMTMPAQWLSLLLLLSLGILSFRAVGMIIAAVVNSPQESQILIQLLYLPMLFLSGATFPVSELPVWLQIVAQFLPATYLYTGMQGILVRGETIFTNWLPALGLIATGALALFIGIKLFRWEKEEKIAGTAKLWLVAVLGPFLLLGAYQAYSRQNVDKAKILYRELRRSRTLLIKDARIITGDGRVIDSGAVLVKGGKIEAIYTGDAPDAKMLKAEAIEASGKTLLPGLIDVHVHLVAPGGIPAKQTDANPEKAMLRGLAAYLYSGITAVKSDGDPLDAILKVRAITGSGQKLGAEMFLCGPLFTAEKGHGTEYFKGLPAVIRTAAESQFVRTPKTAEEARRQVRALKQRGVDGIKVVLESGAGTILFNRMDTGIFRAIVQEAHAQNLPVVVHTGNVRDVQDAVEAGVDGIEHGSAYERIPDALFAGMARRGISYDPTMSVWEAFSDLRAGKLTLLDRSLVEQVGPAALLQSTRKALASPEAAKWRKEFSGYPVDLNVVADNLRSAWKAGVRIVTGSDAGNLLVIHGPTVHRELQLWVKAGIPPMAALEGATWNAARLLRAGGRMGVIAKGRQANLLLVDGNPLEDISATERISTVIFEGEEIDRSELFNQD